MLVVEKNCSFVDFPEYVGKWIPITVHQRAIGERGARFEFRVPPNAISDQYISALLKSFMLEVGSVDVSSEFSSALINCFEAKRDGESIVAFMTNAREQGAIYVNFNIYSA